jgi:inner membrane transporter RhtA
MTVGALVITPIGGWAALPALGDPLALGAGIGVGITSSVIPYVCDQLATARLSRAAYSLMTSLLPATGTAVGLVVLAQVPSLRQLLGVGLVTVAVAVHRDRAEAGRRRVTGPVNPSPRRAA